jgi:hypothetical protein
MSVQQIYDAVLDRLSRRADVDVIRAAYYPDIFGNFIISFRQGEREASVVNERFELFYCSELGGEGNRHSLIDDIRGRTSADVLSTLEEYSDGLIG